MKVALYLRVSTARQAEKDLSIPDQRNQLERWSKDRGWTVVAESEYVEPGASATDDRRPQFQRMMEDATRPDRPFDAVLVHSFSRFFRDSFQFEMHRRTLEKNNVSLISITQAVSEDPSGQMFRQLVAMFDEYQSRETAKHVLRSMKENARLGFWNGSPAPYGYKAVTVEVRADAVKKKLEIDPVEAEIVREIFGLCRAGRGIRLIADHLNRKGLTYRRKGRRWTSGLVHQVLTREAYAGTHYFNRTEAKRGRNKDKAEWVAFETPVIIDPEVFHAVQHMLEARRPTRMAPRVVTGPTLLTGLARCETCGGGMTLRTGKGGRYRYYTCNNRINEGPTSCKGRNIPMQLLDNLVIDNLEARILAPERLEPILKVILDRARNQTTENAAKAKDLRKKLRGTETKIERLYAALADGTVGDTDMFRRSMTQVEAERDETLRMIAALEKHRDVPRHLLTKRNIERFAATARAQLRNENARLRKGYMRQLVSRIEVGDRQIRVSGPESMLAEGVLDSGSDPAAGVPSFVQGWWAHKDSNLGPAD
jgi:site-specific DNA recombinase